MELMIHDLGTIENLSSISERIEDARGNLTRLHNLITSFLVHNCRDL